MVPIVLLLALLLVSAIANANEKTTPEMQAEINEILSDDPKPVSEPTTPEMQAEINEILSDDPKPVSEPTTPEMQAEINEILSDDTFKQEAHELIQDALEFIKAKAALEDDEPETEMTEFTFPIRERPADGSPRTIVVNVFTSVMDGTWAHHYKILEDKGIIEKYNLMFMIQDDLSPKTTFVIENDIVDDAQYEGVDALIKQLEFIRHFHQMMDLFDVMDGFPNAPIDDLDILLDTKGD